MEWQWLNSIIKFCKVVWSYVVALLRLVVWTFVFFFMGLQRTLFMRSEVAGIDFKVHPLRCDMEDTSNKLAYLDKLCLENPDLMGFEDDDDIPFDVMMEDEDSLDGGSSEDNGEDNI